MWGLLIKSLHYPDEHGSMINDPVILLSTERLVVAVTKGEEGGLPSIRQRCWAYFCCVVFIITLGV